MDIFIKVVQLLLCLSLLVFVHELGHFIAAKIFKIRVEKFYLFFNPGFSLFKFTIGETEYGMGWLPFGGYVNIAGMIDESMDTEQMKEPPKPYEFRSKPAWQRLIVMLAGILMNIIAAIVIYIGLLSHYGEQYLPTESVNAYGIMVDSLGYNLGFRDGDKIISIDDEKVESFYDIPEKLLLDDVEYVKVDRNDSILQIPMNKQKVGKMVQAKEAFLSPRFPFIVGDFSEDSPAQKAGMVVGDKIIAINDVQTEYFDEFKKEIGNYANEDIVVKAMRENDTVSLIIPIADEPLIGVYPTTAGLFEIANKDYTFFEAIPAGFVKTFTTMGSYFKQLKLLFSKEVKAYKSLGSFITIGSIFPGVWQWQVFWNLTAFISIILAVMNILPIPALDGGHVLFVLYEIIFRKKPGDKFLERAQMVGMFILLALVALAIWNDLTRFVF